MGFGGEMGFVVDFKGTKPGRVLVGAGVVVVGGWELWEAWDNLEPGLEVVFEGRVEVKEEEVEGVEEVEEEDVDVEVVEEAEEVEEEEEEEVVEEEEEVGCHLGVKAPLATPG